MGTGGARHPDAGRDIKQYLADGSLVPVLPDHETPNADIFAVYSPRHQMSNRIRAFVDFIALDLKREVGERIAGIGPRTDSAGHGIFAQE